MQTLIQANADALAQVIELLEGISDKFYQQEKQGAISGPGAHIRHIIDHYRALQNGLHSQRLDYNFRRRKCAAETDRAVAIEELSSLIEWLGEEFSAVFKRIGVEDQPVNITTEVCFQSSTTMTIESTISRELCYLLNHTVHHIAYVSLLSNQAGFSVSDTIGVAPATLTANQASMQKTSEQKIETVVA